MHCAAHAIHTGLALVNTPTVHLEQRHLHN